ncbi:MAG: zf-HC2 domain-containing protein [Gemmatimonadota bacterium]|nr:zf-HC2 domain-containing protein [Gemmatimonadota bacterium]
MHADTERLQRLLHGELSAEDERELREHLEGCPSCAGRYEEAASSERDMLSLLEALDHPAPVFDADTLSERRPAPSRVRGRVLRWAATAVLGLGLAGAAYAAPNSPLRAWLGARTEAPEPTPPGGIRVDPGERLVIRILAPAELGSVHVEISPDRLVQISGGQASTSFSVDQGEVSVRGLGEGALHVAIPAAAPEVEIRAGNRQVFIKRNTALRAAGRGLEGTGPFVLSLAEGGTP